MPTKLTPEFIYSVVNASISDSSTLPIEEPTSDYHLLMTNEVVRVYRSNSEVRRVYPASPELPDSIDPDLVLPPDQSIVAILPQRGADRPLIQVVYDEHTHQGTLRSPVEQITLPDPVVVSRNIETRTLIEDTLYNLERAIADMEQALAVPDGSKLRDFIVKDARATVEGMYWKEKEHLLHISRRDQDWQLVKSIGRERIFEFPPERNVVNHQQVSETVDRVLAELSIEDESIANWFRTHFVKYLLRDCSCILNLISDPTFEVMYLLGLILKSPDRVSTTKQVGLSHWRDPYIGVSLAARLGFISIEVAGDKLLQELLYTYGYAQCVVLDEKELTRTFSLILEWIKYDGMTPESFAKSSVGQIQEKILAWVFWQEKRQSAIELSEAIKKDWNSIVKVGDSKDGRYTLAQLVLQEQYNLESERTRSCIKDYYKMQGARRDYYSYRTYDGKDIIATVEVADLTLTNCLGPYKGVVPILHGNEILRILLESKLVFLSTAQDNGWFLDYCPRSLRWKIFTPEFVANDLWRIAKTLGCGGLLRGGRTDPLMDIANRIVKSYMLKIEEEEMRRVAPSHEKEDGLILPIKPFYLPFIPELIKF